jgi:hypothetical protein
MTEPAVIHVPVPQTDDPEFQLLGMCVYLLTNTAHYLPLDVNAKARVVRYLNERFGATVSEPDGQ